LIAGSFGRNNNVHAQTLDSAKVPKFGVELPASPEPVVTPPIDVNDPTDDDVPTLKSKLRPEHLEPVFVDDPPKPDPKDAIAKIDAADAKAATTKQVDPKKESGATLRDLYATGSELFLAGSFVEAANVYKQALALDRNFAPAHRGLGFAYQRMGFDALAIESFNKYLALAPGVRDAASIRQRIEQLGGQP
jgi:tetratricopeptide (TPR) repeat protein